MLFTGSDNEFPNSVLQFFFANFVIILITATEISAKLPGQFSLSGQIFLHWAAATLKGLSKFQHKKF